MKVQIISDEGDVLFVSSSTRFDYQAENEELYKAVLSEVLWNLFTPQYRPMVFTGEVRQHHEFTPISDITAESGFPVNRSERHRDNIDTPECLINHYYLPFQMR